MTAQDLTALADKLDELAMKATADTWYIVGYDDSHCLVDSDDDEHPIAETVEYRNAKLICELRNALPQITTALREAARLREAEKITLMLASFKDPRTVSCPDEELELFAKIIEDAKAIHGDLHEDEEPGHGA
jgi:hypothetical protein